MDEKHMLWLIIAFILGFFLKHITQNLVCKNVCPLVEGTTEADRRVAAYTKLQKDEGIADEDESPLVDYKADVPDVDSAIEAARQRQRLRENEEARQAALAAAVAENGVAWTEIDNKTWWDKKAEKQMRGGVSAASGEAIPLDRLGGVRDHRTLAASAASDAADLAETMRELDAVRAKVRNQETLTDEEQQIFDEMEAAAAADEAEDRYHAAARWLG